MKSNFIQRAITGVIFVGVLVGAIMGGPVTFTLLFALITALTIYEFGTIVNRHVPDVQINRLISVLAGVFLFLCFGYVGLIPGKEEVFVPYLFLMLYLMISELYRKQKNPIHNWAYTMMSQMYIALSFSMLNVLAYHNAGAESVSQYNPILPLSIFIFNWVNDSGLIVWDRSWVSTGCLSVFLLKILGGFYRRSVLLGGSCGGAGSFLLFPESG